MGVWYFWYRFGGGGSLVVVIGFDFINFFFIIGFVFLRVVSFFCFRGFGVRLEVKWFFFVFRRGWY